MPDDPPTLSRLSKRQQQVLHATLEATSNGHGPRVEYHIWKRGSEMGYWSGLSLFGHLRKLSDRGYLERTGTVGGYHYTVTRQGREALSDAF